MAAGINPCPLCGAHAFKNFLVSRDYNWQMSGAFTFRRCLSCSLVFQDLHFLTQPLINYYPRFYGTTQMIRSEDIERRLNNPANMTRLQTLEKYFKTGTFLDVGCGSGFFLKYLKLRGWKVSGIDQASEHVDFARKVLGLDHVRKGSWSDAVDSDCKADVISFIHIIEHFCQPVQALAAAKTFLVPGGIVIVETPNIKSWPAMLFRSRWVTLDAPRHVVLFSVNSLSRTLREAGFEILSLKTYSPTTIEYSESIRYLLRDLRLHPLSEAAHQSSNIPKGHEFNSKIFNSKKRGLAKQILHKWENKAYRIINLAADRLGCGCNLLAIARPARTA